MIFAIIYNPRITYKVTCHDITCGFGFGTSLDEYLGNRDDILVSY